MRDKSTRASSPRIRYEHQGGYMIHELDAVVAHLYGLTEPQLRHIFETFHEGWEYQDPLEATLIHFNKWQTHH